MKDVKVLGPGCKRCEATAEMVKKAAADLGLDVKVEKVTDYAAIAGWGIAATPGIVVDGKVRKTWLANDFTLAEIKRLDAGGWFGARFAGERVPTFDESVALVKGKAGLYPELKTPEFYIQRGVNVERLMEAALDRNVLRGPRADVRTPIVLQTFSQNSAVRLANLKIGVPIVLLLDDTNPFESIDRLRQWKGIVQGFALSKSLIAKAPQLLNWSHATGMTVLSYTFRPDAVQQGFLNVADEVDFYLKRLGVDGVITDKNVHQVKAKIISEGANGPCTTSALQVLEDRGAFIIPDVLCNAGGVIVSYFEWVQGLQNFFWSEKEVNAKLAEVMENAFKKVVGIRDQHDCGMKTAALIAGVDRLNKAMLLRGLFP